MILEDIQEATKKLLTTNQLGEMVTIFPLTGGGNNRVFRVETEVNTYLLKSYFQHREDPRDRLGTEYAFSSFAWDNGVRNLPQPLAYDRPHGLGLYEFIPGRKLEPSQVTENFVEQAIKFYQTINHYKQLPEAQSLPKASESCLTIREHLDCVDRRVIRLNKIEAISDVDCQAVSFVQNQLVQRWQKVREWVVEKMAELNLPLDQELSQFDRCLSPSDFGFHNAILTESGQLRFIDFEYAGWDDPGKLVADFFCQPAIPVPLQYYQKFVERVVADLSHPEQEEKRIKVLLPVYQIKWCCIMLNDFLPVGGQRRNFAVSMADREVRKAGQLEKALNAILLIDPM